MQVRAVIMRGGTSKAVFFRDQDLPEDPAHRDALILGVFGSPDPYRRQIDGLGGATSTTSKVAVIGDGSAHGVDVTYDFGQVGIDEAIVDRRGNCGNISSAVGPFAVDEGMVEVTEPITQVRFLNTNTGKVIVAHVPTKDGRFHPDGEFEIPGIPGTAAQIRLDYVDPGGAVTGRLLPTGNVRDTLEVPGVGEIEISLVDAANPLVFVGWSDLGLAGTEHPDEVDADPDLLARIEAVRAAASVLAGIAPDVESATRDVPSVPKLAFVGSARDYTAADGRSISAGDTSLRAAMMSMGRLHRTYPLTGAICTAVAAAIPGTVAADAARPTAVTATADGGELVTTAIGHPSGVLAMQAGPRLVDGEWRIDEVAGYRTARRLMEGVAHVPSSALR